MKKDEKTEKENTARSISEEKNSPEGGEEENREQSASLSSILILITVNLLQKIFLKRIIILFGFLVKKLYLPFV
ncbi:MAG: hypothetical protein CM15mP58_21050 [Burkholderiaceae bacterium]|nr:MAG: hypothetical protein CM15mP58_21050 [Burkholderiaceae bacterium]